jgi:hypothetical protein
MASISPVMAGLFQVDGDNRRTVQNHGSVAFRPVAEDPVFLFAAEDSTELAGRNQGPDIPLHVLPEALAISRLARASLEPCPAFQQRPPDGFSFGFMRQACYLTGQPLYIRVLDIESHGRTSPIFHHSTRQVLLIVADSIGLVRRNLEKPFSIKPTEIIAPQP